MTDDAEKFLISVNTDSLADHDCITVTLVPIHDIATDELNRIRLTLYGLVTKTDPAFVPIEDGAIRYCGNKEQCLQMCIQLRDDATELPLEQLDVIIARHFNKLKIEFEIHHQD